MQVTTQYYLKGSEEALERARKIAETFDWVEFCSPEIPNSNNTIDIREEKGFTVLELTDSYHQVDILDRLYAFDGLTEIIYAVFTDRSRKCITNDKKGLVVADVMFPSFRDVCLDSPCDDGTYVLPEIDLRPDELI